MHVCNMHVILVRVACGSNIHTYIILYKFNTLETHIYTFLFQIMVAFLSYISNACHSLSEVAERLQHIAGFNILYMYAMRRIHI